MKRFAVFLLIATVVAMISLAGAQPPRRPDGGGREGSSKADASSFIKRMMTFDANQDDQLSKAEITDERLLPLFERADENHDGIVTKEELMAIHAREFVEGRRDSDIGGPGGRGPGPGPGGRGGPGMGGPPRFGEVLPPHIKDALNLSSAQLKKIDALQKTIDAKLQEILTDEQNKQLAEMRNRRPGGPEDGGRSRGPNDGPNDNRRRLPDDTERPRRPRE